MSTSHSGNIQNEVTLEEHDDTQNAKRMSLVSAATIYVSTSLSGNITLNPSPNFIGLATVVQGTVPWQSLVSLSPSASWIGLVSVSGNVGFSGNVTINPSPNYIGLATIDIGTQNKITLQGNVTISDSKGYIGLATTTPASSWPDPKTYIGLVTTSNAVAWPDPKTYIGLVTVANTVSTTFAGNVTLDAGSKTAIVGNVTLSDPKTFIGSVSVGGIVDSKGYIGLVTNTLAAVDTKSYLGLMTVSNAIAWTDPKTYIGLVTIGHTANVALVGNVTITNSQGYIGLVTVTPATNISSNRTDTYTTTGNGVTIDVSSRPTQSYAIEVKGTGGVATTWDIRLEGSLDNTNFTQILSHTQVTGDGVVLYSGSVLSPSLYIRSRVAGLVLGSATNVVATILGMG